MKKRLAILGFAAVALLATTWYFVARETPVSVARELLDCARRFDTACLHRRMTKDERADAVATKENLSKFLQTVFGPRIAGFEPSGSPKLTPLAAKQVSIEQPMKHPDGRTTVMVFSVTETDDGIFCDALLRQLLTPCVYAATPAGQLQPTGPAKSALWADSLEAWLPELNATGIVGASAGNSQGRFQVQFWKDMIATFREMSKPRERHHSSDGGVSHR